MNGSPASTSTDDHTARRLPPGRVRLRILLVDDEPGILRVLEHGLSRHDTVAVGSAEAAMHALANERFDVIVSDNDMAEICGLVLLSHVSCVYPRVRRILFSGSAPAALADLRRAGIIDHFVPKPGFGALVRLCDELACVELTP